jgi:hypothetical protein
MILEKEEKTMNYSKPEVEVLGTAVSVIESLQQKGIGSVDSEPSGPAYDLDE